MEIINERVETKLIGSNKEELGRTKCVEGTVYWLKYIGNLKVSGTVHLHEQYIVSGNSWKIWNQKRKTWEDVTENIPTWEQEYQEALLAQYPFEKRVCEIAEKNVGTTTFATAFPSKISKVERL